MWVTFTDQRENTRNILLDAHRWEIPQLHLPSGFPEAVLLNPTWMQRRQMHPEEDAPTPLLKAMTQQQLGWTSPDVCSLCATGFRFEGRFPGLRALK